MNNLPRILALDSSGNPDRWITYEDYAYYAAKDLVAWSMGEFDYTLHGGKSRMTGEQSTMIMNTIVAIKGPSLAKITHRRGTSIPLTNKALFNRDRNLCGYCGNHFPDTKLTRDHVIPSSLNGPDAWTNVVASCKRCNAKKADKTPETANMPLLFVPYAPNRNEFLILSNRRILADQMAFLLKGVPKHSRLYD